MVVLSFVIYQYYGFSYSGLWLDMQTIIVRITNYPFNLLELFLEKFKKHAILLQEVKQLKTTIHSLEKNLEDAQESINENKHLQELLKFSGKNLRLTTRVLRYTKYKGFLSFILQIPYPEAVELNDSVMSQGSLVGRIIKTGALGAYVLPIIDSRSRIPVVFEKSRIEAIIVGNQTSYLPILHSNKSESGAIQNEKVLTSGMDGLLSPGLFVGNVHILKSGALCVSVKKQIPHYVAVIKNAQSFF